MKCYLFFAVLFLHLQVACAQSIGNWSQSSGGLPVYHYTGKLPFTAVDKSGRDAVLPEDPYFLLGNYRMALFTHASGIYQFLTAERAWARINAATRPNYGWNDASIAFQDGQASKELHLTGVNSIAADPAAVQKDFGAGFARYSYKVENGITCTRLISVKPSAAINTGNPSFVVTVVLANNGSRTMKLMYRERMLVNFTPNGTQYMDKQQRPLRYDAKISVDAGRQAAVAALSCSPDMLLVLPAKNERFVYEVDPPAVFMYSKGNGNGYTTVVSADNDTLCTTVNAAVRPGEARTFHIVIGLRDTINFANAEQQANDLLGGAAPKDLSGGLFAAQWKAKLPDLSAEKDEVLKREMLWNAHVVEASAKYSDYYKETFIPQGTVYSYHFGDNISNRDHLQAALPACYTNPALAKSSIRYVMKHTETDGEIKRGNTGYGYTQPGFYQESDEQLYLFNTVSEYLLITKDYAFLNERVAFYPAEYGKSDTVLNILKKHFIYLRDQIGTGPNGLVKMLNSDWSDSFFHDYSPNRYGGSAESLLNSAMVLAIFPKLVNALQRSGNRQAGAFITALETYRSAIDRVFMKDLGDRKFAARAYLGSKLKFGLDNVCIEPQGYLLQNPTLSPERKKDMYAYIKSKILAPEKIGIRTREKPLWKGNPDGEDGGIWYSLEYPVLLGVATFDKEEAWALMKKFSFQHFTEQYPDYWVGQWTAPDEINSTLYREGLYSFWVSVPDLKKAFQGYCSHPHTWPLFCYFKLKE